MATRKNSPGSDVCITEEIQRNESIVAGGFWIIEDLCELSEVRCAQEMRNLEHRCRSERGECFGGDLEETSYPGFNPFDTIGSEEPILGRVWAEGEEVLMNKFSHPRTVPVLGPD